MSPTPFRPTLLVVSLTCLLLITAARPASAQAPVATTPPAIRVVAADGLVLLDALADPARRDRLEIGGGRAFAVTLQYPLSMAGTEVVVDPLDGGRIDGRPWRKLTVNPLGLALFTFTAGNNLGKYQVELRAGAGSAALEFWVNTAGTANP